MNNKVLMTENLLDRSNGAFTKLINYISDRPGHDFRYALE